MRSKLSTVTLAVYWLLLATLTHLPPVALPKTGGDKYAHFVAYFVLGFLLNLVLGRKGVTLQSTVISIVIACAYGAIDEWTQPLVGRICDLHDWYADVFGATTGASMVLVFKMVLQAGRVARR